MIASKLFSWIFSASTASSSGMNSRCDDVPTTDTVDSSAISSREDNGINPSECNGTGECFFVIHHVCQSKIGLNTDRFA